MKRRMMLAATAGVLGSAWGPRVANACGGHIGQLEEEFIDRVGPNGQRALLARYGVDGRFSVTSSERLATSADEQVVAYAQIDHGAFTVLRADGRSLSVPAPEGGQALFHPQNPATLALSLRHVGRRQLVLVNTRTLESELWEDFIDVRSVAFSTLGIVVAHDRPQHGGGTISLVTGRYQTRELRRINNARMLTQSHGLKLGYFAETDAYTTNIDTGEHARVGTAPYRITAAAWYGDGLLGATEEGAYYLRSGRDTQRLISEPELFTLFEQGKYVVAASARAVFVLKEGGRVWWTYHAEGGGTKGTEIHDVRPTADSDGVLIVQGSGVYRAKLSARTTHRIAEAREDTALRGAVLFGKDVLTWGTRSWHKTEEGRCDRDPVAKGFL